MKKKTFLQLTVILLFGICLAGILAAASRILERGESRAKYADFFELSDQIDVLFLGSSHVINGLSPLDLYEQYGFTSYNMGGHGSEMPETYWELKLARQYCQPKVVVIDAYMMEKDFHYQDVREGASKKEINTSVEQLHLNMDCFPYSRLKKEAVEDLILDPSIRRQFLFPFITYHDRWSELHENDFRRLRGRADRNLLMGAEMRYHTYAGEIHSVAYLKDAGMEAPSVGAEYLIRIIEECQADGIGVVVTTLPFHETETDWRTANGAALIAESMGVPDINFLKMSEVNAYTDFNDQGHLNHTGAEKVTAYIGRFLQENFALEDHREQEGYERWDERLKDYREELEEQERDDEFYDLYGRMNELSFSPDGVIVYVREGSDAIRDQQFSRLIEHLTGDNAPGFKKARQAGLGYILIRDTGSGLIREIPSRKEVSDVPTAIGSLSLLVSESFRNLYVDGDMSRNLLDMADHFYDDVQIISYDPVTGEIIHHASYRYNGAEYVVQH